MGDTIVKVLDKLGQQFGITIDWTANNIMPYVKQYVAKIAQWEIATSLVWMVVGVVILVLGICCWKKFKKEEKKERDYYTGDEIPYFVVSCLAILVSFSILITQSIDIATAITFPEKTAIHFIQDLQHNE